MRVFVNTLIENPAFDSQTKEQLTSLPSTFGSSCTLSEKFYKAVFSNATGIVEAVVAAARRKQTAELQRKASKRPKLLDIPKLEDAHRAGTADGHKCTLILTEGDSAKALAVAGLEVVGREHYGVFPLKGKILNVRDASPGQIAGSPEISKLLSILGLSMVKDYSGGLDKHARCVGL
jgi:DNA topoisomerase-2